MPGRVTVLIFIFRLIELLAILDFFPVQRGAQGADYLIRIREPGIDDSYIREVRAHLIGSHAFTLRISTGHLSNGNALCPHWVEGQDRLQLPEGHPRRFDE